MGGVKRGHFDAYWTPEPNTGCWLWFGGRDPDGYGIFAINGKSIRAHRANQRDPGNQLVRHKCDTPECVNPDHLLLGSYQDNMDDMVERGRSAKGDRSGKRLHPESIARGDRNGSRTHPERLVRQFGEANGQTKLTVQQVEEIKLAIGTCKELGRRYGVSASQISRIKLGQRWSHTNGKKEPL